MSALAVHLLLAEVTGALVGWSFLRHLARRGDWLPPVAALPAALTLTLIVAILGLLWPVTWLVWLLAALLAPEAD